MRKRAWKRIISTLLIVCMLAGVAPVTQMQQVEAFDILGIAERMGCVVRGGMNAYETAKKENWDAGEAFFGTFKSIGKEMLGIGKDESPGSTVIVNQVDLSEVESELASIQNSLDKQSISLKKLESGGYITRETTESDNRTHRVTITPKGRSVIERSEQMFWETEKAMFEGFSEEEMQSLQQFFERIYENLLRDQQKEE